MQQFNYAQKEPHDLVAPHEFIKVFLELLNLSEWNVRQFNFAQKEPQDLVAPHEVIKVLPEQFTTPPDWNSYSTTEFHPSLRG